MVKPDPSIHYDYIPLKGHTKEWFQKDIQTIKKSFIATLKTSPIINFCVFAIIGFIDIIAYRQLQLEFILTYTLALLPIALLGYFLLHVMKTKGYDIKGPGTGPIS